MKNPGVLFLVSAPSGAGKTSLVNALVARLGPEYSIARQISYTSKVPRPGERNGVDYHFITAQEFEAKIEEGFFIEYSTVYGTYYGSPRSSLIDVAQGASRILVIDRLGAQHIVQQAGKLACLIWITVPSLTILEDRLRSRGQDSEEQIIRRLGLARVEIEEEATLGLYHHHILNDSFEIALENLEFLVKSLINREEKKEMKRAVGYAQK